MDGTVGRILLRCAATAVVVWLAGCSSLDPQPEPLPYSLYDSPLIAGGIPGRSLQRPKGPPKARAPSENDAAANRSTNSNDTTSRPSLSTSRGSVGGSEGDEAGLSNSEAEAKTPEPASKSDSKSDGSPAHPRAAQYVAVIYELNDVPIPQDAHNDIAALYRHCRDEGGTFQSRKPATGDMVFFHNVEDANGDGRNNDWYTYVALVEHVDSSGTVTLLGYRDGRVRTFRMNRSRPDVRKRGGQTLNTQLRDETPGDPPYTQYLAGELFAGYCALLGDTSELLVVDNWQPGMDVE